MKNKDFAQIAKHLLPAVKGFAIKAPLMYMQPIGHTLRGFYFESHSYEVNLFYVWVFFLPLFVPTKHISFNLGKRLSSSEGERWNADAPNVLSDLRLALERDGLPFLRGLRSAHDVAHAAQALGRSQDLYVQQVIAYALTYEREVEQARKTLEVLINMVDITVPWQSEIGERAAVLRGKLLTTSSEAVHQLDAWKAESLRNLGLQEKELRLTLTSKRSPRRGT